MTWIVLILLSAVSFLLGLIVGLLHRPKMLPEKIRQPLPAFFPEEMERLREEYHNFLNYDGSAQV